MFKRRDVIIILWMTFFTVVAWIGFGIYHIWTTSTISEIDMSAISPINPNFDTSVINSLKSRESVAPLYNFNKSSASKTASVGAKTLPTSKPQNIVPRATGSP